VKNIFKKQTFRIALGVYIFLWIITGILGEFQINRNFDSEFAVGTKAMFGENLKREGFEITKRLDKLNVRTCIRSEEFPEPPWKYRSRAVPIAPFILVDKCAFYTGGLCGWGGLRFHVWFFGITRWWHALTFWVS